MNSGKPGRSGAASRPERRQGARTSPDVGHLAAQVLHDLPYLLGRDACHASHAVVGLTPSVTEHRSLRPCILVAGGKGINRDSASSGERCRQGPWMGKGSAASRAHARVCLGCMAAPAPLTRRSSGFGGTKPGRTDCSRVTSDAAALLPSPNAARAHRRSFILRPSRIARRRRLPGTGSEGARGCKRSTWTLGKPLAQGNCKLRRGRPAAHAGTRCRAPLAASAATSAAAAGRPPPPASPA